MTRPRLPFAPAGTAAAARRRRRLWPALGACLVAIVVLVVVVVGSAGSDGAGHPPLPGGDGSVSVLQIPRAAPSPGHRTASAPFVPAPAAVTLAGKLPLAAQVAQLFMVSVEGSSAPGVSALGGIDWGGVVLTKANFSSDSGIGALAGGVDAAASAGNVKPLIAATQEGGSQSAVPDLPPEPEPVVGSSGQPAIAEAQARLAAKRLRVLGIDMTLAPLADVDTPGGALSGRLFSSDPRAVASFSVAAVRGYSGAHVIAAVGHFPGTGAASADPDQMTATVGGSLAELRARDLIPFAAIAPSAPVIVMSNAAYAAFDGVTPAGLLAAAVDLLRDRLGYQGVVMTDDLDATVDPTNQTPAAVAVQALKAGDDLLYISGPVSEHVAAYDGVLAAAQRSAAVRAEVHAALLRVLTLKALFGLTG